MKDRVRLIRKHFALTQEQFANKIHRTSGFISNVENGKSGLSDTTIALICSEFSVRDDWLRNGAEPMFLPEKDTEVVDKGLIGSRIRDVRMGKGLSQAEFGKRIGFHKNQVYNVENGKSIPSDEFLSAVSREFNVSYLRLRTGEADERDPLARDRSYTWGGYENGEFVLHEPADPDKMIWCAEVTASGRGKDKKIGVVLMSANCGFCVISCLPPFTPSDPEKPTRDELKEYRSRLESVFIDAIRDGFLAFSLPTDRVLDYTDTVRNVELVKGRTSTPAIRLEELIERELKWESGVDPVERFNVRGNWTQRKFGNGDYRHVEKHTCSMLGMSEEEQEKWLEDFLAPMRERMKA